MSSNVWTTLRLSVFFLTLSYGYIYVTWVKTKFAYVCIIYIEFIFPSSSAVIWICFEAIPFFFPGIVENEKKTKLVFN